jgi:hypothetical protein
MAAVKHPIEEHDVVAMPEPIGDWPAGMTGTIVSKYDVATLVEVDQDDPPESILDYLVPVPFEKLELCWSHRTGRVAGMEA